MSMKDRLHTGELYLPDDGEIGSSSFWFFLRIYAQLLDKGEKE